MSTAKATEPESDAAVSEGVYEGVKVSEVEKARLKKYLGSKATNVVKLLDEYRAKMKELMDAGTALVHCNNCNALLAEDQQECPVCGDVDEADSLDVSKSIVVPAGGAELVSERLAALDAAVADVKRLKGEVFKSGVDLGLRLFDIYEGKLWLERKDDAGAPRFKNFEEFSKGELGMSGVHARNMILVARLPKQLPGATRDVIDEVGFTKLKIVATANVHDRAALFELAKENAPLRELMREAKMLSSQRAVGASPGTAARRPTSPVAPVLPPPVGIKGGVTVVFKMGKVQLKLEKDPKTGNLRGREELLNAVVTYYDFNPKTCVLTVTREREEE